MGLDVAFGVLLLLGAWQGAKSGFSRLMLNFTGLLLGVLFAAPISRALQPHLAEHLGAIAEPIRPSALYLGVVLGVWLGFWTIGSIYLSWYRNRIFGENVPSMPDRMLGVALGGAAAAFLVCVAVSFWPSLPNEVREQSFVKKQYEQSKGVKLADEYRAVVKVLESPEVAEVKKHFRVLMDHYRQPPRTAAAAPPELR